MNNIIFGDQRICELSAFLEQHFPDSTIWFYSNSIDEETSEILLRFDVQDIIFESKEYDISKIWVIEKDIKHHWIEWRTKLYYWNDEFRNYLLSLKQ